MCPAGPWWVSGSYVYAPLCPAGGNVSGGQDCIQDYNPNPTNVNLAGIQARFIDLANRWFAEHGIVGNPRIDKYDQVVNTALANGVDPIFTLAIWLHESGASNYSGICQAFGNSNPSSGYCQRIQDFGINRANIETVINVNGNIVTDHFNDQLAAFVQLPAFYLTTCNVNTVTCPMDLFGAMFRDGNCQPSSGSSSFMASVLEIYGWLAPGQKTPCYPIALP